MILRNSLGKSGGDNEGGRDGETGVMLVCATVFYKKLVYKYELKKKSGLFVSYDKSFNVCLLARAI